MREWPIPSDDGDIGLGTPAQREAVIDRDLDALVLQFSDTLAIPTREIYDGLIRAARKVRGGRNLTEFR